VNAAAVEQAPDFCASCGVQSLRKIESHTKTPTSQSLSSHHESPSYTVTASERRARVYETGTLAIEVADGRQRQPVWRGVEARRVRQSFESPVAATAAKILEHLPPEAQP
jgi:hypothetical protein